ncbi:hypothetical protein KC332_g4762 [Hortaea werneckii]|nr:hypothetical protein KC358_g4734 [Hortaea werneckii]KAI6846625.1 hypothetical protein KC350_g3823 [Hortaea werneckii]KAI6934180.1 hypothetical protein KC348_g6570 [Hortaea werneckii]KAI6938915.1 hypothetical protein KC341_g4581 [Hortaea werneckii]KAI6974890.1 hypothetical protein KC321_g4859 [Hortaea werneckii]
MPTHDEHLAGIEEATSRVRALKAKFDNTENDWCSAAKQLQGLRELRQRWIDEYGYVPSDPLMWTLLQPSQKFYIRKAKEYLAVSREMAAAIAQRDLRICRYLDFLNKESSTEEQDEPGARAERDRAAYRERMRQQRSARAEAEERQRQEEAQRQQREEEAQRQRRKEAQRQEQARAKAKERERREEKQRQEKARQEQAWRQAHAKQQEQAKRQHEQAQQDSRKRRREQAESESQKQQQQQQQEPRKRQKSHPHPPSTEHNTLAPTLPYGNLTPTQATLEWRARFLHPWPTDFYRSLRAFPAPPPIPCPTFPCCPRTNNSSTTTTTTTTTTKILNVCDVFLRETFEALSRDELRDQRIKWHPDRFSACPEGEGGGYREAFQKMAGEVFVVVNGVFERKKKEEEEEGRKKRMGGS